MRERAKKSMKKTPRKGKIQRSRKITESQRLQKLQLRIDELESEVAVLQMRIDGEQDNRHLVGGTITPNIYGYDPGCELVRAGTPVVKTIPVLLEKDVKPSQHELDGVIFRGGKLVAYPSGDAVDKKA